LTGNLKNGKELEGGAKRYKTRGSEKLLQTITSRSGKKKGLIEKEQLLGKETKRPTGHVADRWRKKNER